MSWQDVAVFTSPVYASTDEDRESQWRADSNANYAKGFTFASMVTDGIVTPKWLPGSDRFCYVTGDRVHTEFTVFDPETASAEPLFDTAPNRVIGHKGPMPSTSRELKGIISHGT